MLFSKILFSIFAIRLSRKNKSPRKYYTLSSEKLGKKQLQLKNQTFDDQILINAANKILMEK